MYKIYVNIFTYSVGSCNQPERPKNGIVYVHSRLIGSEIHYACLSGFSLMGASVALCKENTTWSQPTPQCGKYYASNLRTHWSFCFFLPFPQILLKCFTFN